ncbi:MAG: benzoyl-CoA reductase subunit B [Deltaproteobacteria bacterium]|nr:benzoyl-CoA reductase subunit B [Deltaproteobacteria bacterium]
MKLENVQKEDSQLIQKKMIADHFNRLSHAKELGKKVVYTFVPGNLNELIWALDMLPVHPEINALQSGMRQLSGGYIIEAEKAGHSEDVCTYVKCDVGMLKQGNIGPTGEKLPAPDLLLLSYTGCFTFMKWFEILQKEYNCPVVMLQVPYQGDGEITAGMRQYVVDQLRDIVIPALEKVAGRKLDSERLHTFLTSSARSEEDLVAVWDSARHHPSPIDAYFGGVYYIGPIFTAFRGLAECEQYYRSLRKEVEYRIQNHQGPTTPEGLFNNQKFRLVVEGPPNWTSFRDLWKMFYGEGAVVVASTYTKVGGLYEYGFRHDPDRPFESMADYCLGCYTNRNIPTRIEMLEKYMSDFEADGFIINSIKSCNSFSAGQLLMLRELEKRTGKPGAFIESDLVDPRYFSAANIKNRLDSYFQMVEARRS